MKKESICLIVMTVCRLGLFALDSFKRKEDEKKIAWMEKCVADTGEALDEIIERHKRRIEEDTQKLRNRQRQQIVIYKYDPETRKLLLYAKREELYKTYEEALAVKEALYKTYSPREYTIMIRLVFVNEA